MVRVAEPRRRVRVRVRRKRRRRHRRRLAIAAAVLAVVAGLALVTQLSAGRIRARLVQAEAAMLAGRSSLVAGDVEAARSAFERAESSFIQARGIYRNPVVLGLSYLPVLGRTPDAAGAVIEAGVDAAAAGGAVASAVERLPEGLGALSPDDGVIPIDVLEDVAPSLRTAADLLGEAEDRIRESPHGLLLGEVDAARRRLRTELADAHDVLAATASMARALPEMFGGGPKRYFVAAQNPAELRGTGGFIGAYAILTAEDGRLRMGEFRTIQTLQSFDVRDVEPPTPGYAARYDRFGGAAFWQNLNMTPDFPSAATAIENLYQLSEGEPLDGVIAADPFALAEMLRATAPVDVAATGATLDADTLVPYVTNEAYAEITNPVQRKRLLGEIAGAVLDRFLAGGVDPVAGGQALVRAAGAGHLLLHSTDPVVQASLEEAGVAGALDTDGDLFAAIANNAAGNKADFYLDAEMRYSVRLGAEGGGHADATVEYTNDAPDSGEPAYVIGPFTEEFEPGQNVMYLSTYCARGCLLEGFWRNGRRSEVAVQRERGHPVFSSVLEMPSGAHESLRYAWTIRGAWVEEGDEGIYRLTVPAQPTIRPTTLRVDIAVPEGMEVLEAEGMRVGAGRVTWEGAVVGRTTFEVRFARPFLAEKWHDVTELLSRPVFRVGD